MKSFKLDLHIHSLLSPCADLGMSPKEIVCQARKLGLDGIAICDHNATHQLSELQRLCLNQGLYLFYGTEITTREEVHVVALLPTLTDCKLIQKYIDCNLVKLPYNADKLGDQIWVDADEMIAGEVEWYLNAPLEQTLEEVVNAIHQHHGLAIAAHIDRPSYSVVSQLGFIPEQLAIDAIEYQWKERLDEILELQPEYHTLCCYQSSDAHTIEQIGAHYATLIAHNLSFSELQQALKQRGGRNLF